MCINLSLNGRTYPYHVCFTPKVRTSNKFLHINLSNFFLQRVTQPLAWKVEKSTTRR